MQRKHSDFVAFVTVNFCAVFLIFLELLLASDVIAMVWNFFFDLEVISEIDFWSVIELMSLPSNKNSENLLEGNISGKTI